MYNVCFIPARNSSMRLKNKNISKFGNGTLITNTIKQAIESEVFDEIILSSNDESILEMGEKYPVELHIRTDKHDKLIDVIRESDYGSHLMFEDTLCLLLVTCPLRQVSDIRFAYDLFMKEGRKNTVVSVKVNENPIQMSFKMDENELLKPVFPDEFKRSTRKQDHYKTYFYNDAVIFDTVERWMDPERTLYGDNPIPYVMPWERSITIDYDFQLKLARCLGEGNVEI